MTQADNPKDAIGSKKLPVHLWPSIATAYGAIGMLEGATKYGRNNFIAAPVRAHIYVAAAMRHLMAWMEGEECSEEGGPHLGNALATIAIILKARQNGTLIDDREFLTDPTDDAYGREVKKLVAMSKVIVERVKPGTEPKHWDRRDAMSLTPAAQPQEPSSVALGGTLMRLPPEAVVKEEAFRCVTLAYSGPVPGDGLTTPITDVEYAMTNKGWSYEQIMLRRKVLVLNPGLFNTAEFKRQGTDNSLKVTLR